MNSTLPYFSIRWKIISLASLVLGLTSALFIWQQYQLQLREFELNQTKFSEHTRDIVEHLIQSQAERMQMLGNLLVEQPNVREDILHQRGEQLVRTVDAIETELSLGQGVATVAFHDADQKLLAVWGDSANPDNLVLLSRVAATQEKPKTHIECNQTCLYYTVLPISQLGRTIATVTLISNLEYFLNDLHRLSNSDVAVLHGRMQGAQTPVSAMRIVSASGGVAIRGVLEAARSGIWRGGRFQLAHDGQVHQVMLAVTPLVSDSQINFAIIPDVTSKVQAIDYEAKYSLMRGAVILCFAMLLLYAMLRPTMRRLHHVSRTLPLLGEEKFTEVRESYANRPGGNLLGIKWKDEVDELEGLALALAARLEQLRKEARQHTDLLAAQSSQLKQEWDFVNGLLDTAPVLILSYSSNGLIKLANSYALKTCGRLSVVGQDYAALFLGVSQQDYAVELSKMQSGVVFSTASTITQSNGNVSDVLWYHVRLAVGEDGLPTYLSVGMDITEHKKNEARIHNLAFYDPLTRLPNRRMLTDCVRHAFAASARGQTHCALVFIDIDNFKAVNESKGQATGDYLIGEMAKRLRGGVREFDTVAHLGGDEFVVLLEELHEEVGRAATQARLIAEKLRSKISQPCLLHDFTHHLTSSVGISLFSGDGVSVDVLFRHANIAMSHAKISGRNALCFFDPEMQVGLEARAALEADLRLALSQHQFQLFYQVQMNRDGQALGAEALLRWFHPQRGIVPPSNFIPLAEESELILSIGLWVLETACAQIKTWEADRLSCELQLAVNVSVRQFHQPDFVEQVLRALEQSGANPARLKLELTESLILNDIPDAISKMQQLKKHGVRFSIDDFGTAYSSLSYLTQLPLDQLKIDQSFVRNIGVKSSDAIIVQTIINMAKNLGMEVIAEGVETRSQCEFLEQAGCLNYQGYLFSKPLALDVFTAYLTDIQC